MCKSLTNYFPRNNDFLVTYFGKTQINTALLLCAISGKGDIDIFTRKENIFAIKSGGRQVILQAMN